MSNVEVPELLNLASAPTAIPYRYGLFSAVEFAPMESVRDRFGTTWNSDNCAEVGITFSACKDPAVPDLVPAECSYTGIAEGFTAYLLNEDSIAGSTIAEHEDRTRARFAMAEQAAVEQRIYTELALAAVADSSMVSVTGLGAKGPSDSYLAMLATVEEQLALVSGSEGVIYMSRFAAIALSSELDKTSGRLRTKLGTPVAAMAGFGAVAATLRIEDAMYGSGPVKASRSEIELANGTAGAGLSINDVSIIAQRDYTFGWDCGVVGASVTF